jgi:hypothetical protein
MYPYRPIDPRALMLVPRAAARPWPQIGGVDGGECDPGILPKVVWPSDVDRFKAQLDPLVRATNTSVEQCAGLSAADKQSWATFFAEWNTFAARKTPTFGSSNEWEHACSSARVVDGWRDKIQKTGCKVVGPEQIKGAEQEKTVDMVQLVAKSAVVVAGITLLIVYAPEIKAAVGGLFGKRST